MKFLLVNHEYPPIGGGAATATREIAHNLSVLGNEVAVVTSGYRKLRQLEIEDHVVIHRTISARRRMDSSNILEMLSFAVAAPLWLPWLLYRHRPDAMIVFFSLPSGPIGLLANLFGRVQYVVSLRGGDVPGLVPELNPLHRLLAPLRRMILGRAVAVVANSEGLRRLSQQADPFRVRVIPNGVDTNFFQPHWKQPSDRLRILFVGRFQKQKNLEFLLEQIATLPHGTFELHLAGDGPLKRQLRRRAAELGIEAEVVWHGWVSRPALPEIYNSVDCLVNPSHYEGLPNVILEAMACSLPVVATNVPGNNELVRHGETGFLFDLDDPNALAREIMQLQDADLRVRMGECGRARAVAEFSWRAVAVGYLRLFEDEFEKLKTAQRI